MNKQRYDIMIGMQAKELVSGVKSAKGSLKDLKQTFKDTLDVLNTSPEQFGFKVTKELEAARKKAAQLVKEVEKLEKSGKMRLQDATAMQRAKFTSGVPQLQGMIAASQPSVIAKKAMEESIRADVAKAKATRELQNKTITLRYALYDIASAAQAASTSLLGYASSAVMAAAAQERAFSQIEKTMVGDTTTEQLRQLRAELIDLSTEIPVSFAELTKIGMLGSQLGIAAEDIAKFTEVTAKFSAITGMSVEESAMGFGKLQNLLGLQGDQFQALGSAIAKVGVESAATEQQIINTGGQIAAVAKAAGFSASEIIGLSASFASLKIAPEEARGVTVRTFNEINKAVSTFSQTTGNGSERLKRFSQIAGMTAKEFADGWGDKKGGASQVFEKFIRGLSTRNASFELRQLGLDGVRTSKGLTALAGDVEAVFGKNGTIAIARKAGAKGTFLDESFATIVEDLASKLEMLKNSFENLLASVAGQGDFLAVIGAIVDGITRVNEALASAANKSDIVAGFLQLTVVLAAVVGGLLALGAAAALAGAGAAAMRTGWAAFTAMQLSVGKALAWVKAQIIATTATAKASNAGFVGMGAAAGTAAAGVFTLSGAMRALKLALVSTGVGALVVILGELAAALWDAFDGADPGAAELDRLNKELERVQTEAEKAKQELIDFVNQGLEPIADAVGAEEALYNLGKALGENGNKWSQYSASGRANIMALQATIKAYVQAFGGDAQTLANNLEALKQYMIAMGMGGQLAFEMIDMAIGETGAVATAAVANFKSFDAGLKDVAVSAGTVKTALERMTEAFDKAFTKFDRRLKLEESLDAFGEALAENGKKLNFFSKSGRDNLNALRAVIFSLKDRLAGNPQSLANSLASLRRAMVLLGITSKAAFKMIDAAMEATGKKGKALKKIVEALLGTISQSMEEAKPLRSITDYAKDLGSVLDDALNNRYARQDTRDSISSAWQTIAESADAAKKAIDDANASISEMQADKNILEYQLQVAIRYGDTLRAEAIKAKLAKLNQQLADKQEDLADAQAEANKTLVGNSKYAIQNRAAVRDLVSKYNDYLVSLAATGMSSEDLQAEAANLAEEFLSQGESMGFAREELMDYTDAFKQDFTTVVKNLPKDVTLNVVTDPALQAVIDFVKDTNAELAKILSGTIDINVPTPPSFSIPGGGGPSGGTPGSGTGTGTGTGTGLPKATATAIAKLIEYRRLRDIAKNIVLAYENRATPPTKAETAAYIQAKADRKKYNDLIDALRAKWDFTGVDLSGGSSGGGGGGGVFGGGSRPFARGGLVKGPGSGTSDSIRALLSNGEYVLRANAVRYYGTDFMNALNQMQVTKPSFNKPGSDVVYLSPDDRALLRAAIDRPIALYTENTRIAESANAGNVILAQRGMK